MPYNCPVEDCTESFADGNESAAFDHIRAHRGVAEYWEES